MLCQLCEEEEAFLSLIPTGGDGLPQTVGPRCFALIGLQTAKDNLPAEEIAAALGPMFVRPPSPEEVANENPPAKPRNRKSKAKTEAPQGEVGRAAEAPPAAANE